MRKTIVILMAVAMMAGCGDTAPKPSAPVPTVKPKDPFASYSAAVRKYYTGADLQAAGDPTADAEVRYFQPPRPAQAGIGQAITLTGSNVGVQAKVTLDAVKTVRKSGKPYTIVDLRLRNEGITVYDGTLQSASLSYANGVDARVATNVKAGCAHRLDASLHIDVGRSRSGCLMFAAADDAPVTQLRLALETVPAQAGGIWKLR